MCPVNWNGDDTRTHISLGLQVELRALGRDRAYVGRVPGTRCVITPTVKMKLPYDHICDRIVHILGNERSSQS